MKEGELRTKIGGINMVDVEIKNIKEFLRSKPPTSKIAWVKTERVSITHNEELTPCAAVVFVDEDNNVDEQAFFWIYKEDFEKIKEVMNW